ncbi:class I SAM-dependent methyltransferase [Actinomadura logoneensis]|uniref:Class I SAM-dependent methyltransferase n=1 Tax=Actinomadura logoneensis TaxID=2293572 RepID=A0A372JKT2_9ACTN|nr:class I SAM-dependent methyltransferase [Actinomadura logoneensis]RFU39938.1 class I SAM-dependent methyltransferase [Actinomadura logoneensis]
MANQFDTLPDTYDDFTTTPFRVFLETPSVLGVLGDVRGAAVLDLGCGSGAYTRLVRQRGAARVSGLDVSEGMIAHARAREAAHPLGVEYFLGDLPDRLAGAFDLVLGVYVLPYAATRAELGGLCATAARALRPGGRFVTLPIHPCFRSGAVSYAPYGFRMTAVEPLADGSPVSLNLRFNGRDHDITARYWSRAALEDALREAGFTSPRFSDPVVSEEGIAEHGAAFWNDYLAHPHTVIIDCRKRSVRADER